MAVRVGGKGMQGERTWETEEGRCGGKAGKKGKEGGGGVRKKGS